jgi:hypothetical protein
MVGTQNNAQLRNRQFSEYGSSHVSGVSVARMRNDTTDGGDDIACWSLREKSLNLVAEIGGIAWVEASSYGRVAN